MKSPVTRPRPVAIALAVLLISTGAAFVLKSAGPGDRHVVADFPRTTSLYVGAKVKVLGVPIGTVKKISVVGSHVRADISYTSEVKLPKDVRAVIVPPSIVGDRFVQLSPAYTSGPQLPQGATLGLDRTSVPVELDDTYRGLDRLVTALGPTGANKDGALSRLISAAAAGINGNGQQFNDTVRQLAAAIGTLADNSGDADATVVNLSKISGTLSGNDAHLRTFVTKLASVGTALNSQGEAISTAVTELRSALTDLAGFLRRHHDEISRSVRNVNAVSGDLARRSEDLNHLLKLAPVGLTSFINIIQPNGWSPAQLGSMPIGAQTTSETLRGDLLEDLDTQLGALLGSLCHHLPASSAQQLSALCTTLQKGGGDLGSVLEGLLGGGSVLSLTPGSTSLGGLLGGRR